MNVSGVLLLMPSDMQTCLSIAISFSTLGFYFYQVGTSLIVLPKSDGAIHVGERVAEKVSVSDRKLYMIAQVYGYEREIPDVVERLNRGDK